MIPGSRNMPAMADHRTIAPARAIRPGILSVSTDTLWRLISCAHRLAAIDHQALINRSGCINGYNIRSADLTLSRWRDIGLDRSHNGIIMMLWFMLNNNASVIMLWFMLNNNAITRRKLSRSSGDIFHLPFLPNPCYLPDMLLFPYNQLYSMQAYF